MARKSIFFCLLILPSWIYAQNIPKGFFLCDESLSPDKHYGVLAPLRNEHTDSENPKNSLIEIKTGKVLAVIEATTGWDNANHQEILPSRWSPDGSLLLWEVDGKWFSDALVLLKLEKGAVTWQRNIMKAGQQAILVQTKKAVSEKYAAAKKATAGNGSAYPEGFSIDVEIIGPITLPLKLLINLTSNPKEIGDFPTLESHLEGSLDAQGNFTFKNFGLGASPKHSFLNYPN